jgi:thiol-disulfide isomerase/thioredoxin
MPIFESVMKTISKEEVTELVGQLLAKRSITAELSSLDVMDIDPLLKDLFEIRQFYQLLDRNKTALSDDMMTIFRERVSDPGLREPIVKLQDYYSQLSKQDIHYTESLKKTDHLKDAKDADALFAQLTEPYKDKVVYIDFWGTWCGPCRQQMKYVGAVKEALKGKDIIFMYFANRSPEKSWKNVIKENHLSGENVVHYRLPEEQQAMIERRLSIKHYPTFILMDKEGNIVNMEAPRPQQKDQLVKEINKLIAL